jgi:hypothetical protein
VGWGGIGGSAASGTGDAKDSDISGQTASSRAGGRGTTWGLTVTSARAKEFGPARIAPSGAEPAVETRRYLMPSGSRVRLQMTPTDSAMIASDSHGWAGMYQIHRTTAKIAQTRAMTAPPAPACHSE